MARPMLLLQSMESRSRNIEIPVDGLRLDGQWCLPGDPRGIVLFAHGSGSSRLSPRNRQVAAALQAAGFSTVLFDLLSGDEDRSLSARFDVDLLTERLTAATRWAEAQKESARLRLGYFGASTGAAAALGAAAELPESVAAIVSRGGRPDLAAHALSSVRAPTLLIVGGEDEEVLELNRMASRQMRCMHRIEVVQGATHLFEEPGALQEVERLASQWFERYLPSTREPGRRETGVRELARGVRE